MVCRGARGRASLGAAGAVLLDDRSPGPRKVLTGRPGNCLFLLLCKLLYISSRAFWSIRMCVISTQVERYPLYRPWHFQFARGLGYVGFAWPFLTSGPRSRLTNAGLLALAFPTLEGIAPLLLPNELTEVRHA